MTTSMKFPPMMSNNSSVKQQKLDHGDENEDEELKKRLEELLSLGKQIESTSKSVDINVRPDYFNEERFKRAQGVLNKYYANSSLGSSSGKSRTVCDLHDRYLMTALAIRKYYETNIIDKESEGWKYIILVRGMHQRIHQVMQKDQKAVEMRKIEEPGTVWVNQYDMALTQFAFIGLFLLNPKKCGAYYTTRQELEDVTYFWRILSYYLGIEERFNLFVFDQNLEKQVKYMNIIFTHIKELLEKSRNQIGVAMAEGITLAFEDFTKESSFNILDHHWSSEFSLSGLKELKPYSNEDKFKLLFFKFYFNVLFKNDKLRFWASNIYRSKFIKFAEKGDKNKRKLAKKYSHITYEYTSQVM